MIQVLDIDRQHICEPYIMHICPIFDTYPYLCIYIRSPTGEFKHSCASEEAPPTVRGAALFVRSGAGAVMKLRVDYRD